MLDLCRVCVMCEDLSIITLTACYLVNAVGECPSCIPILLLSKLSKFVIQPGIDLPEIPNFVATDATSESIVILVLNFISGNINFMAVKWSLKNYLRETPTLARYQRIG